MAKPIPVFAVRLEAALRVKPFVSSEPTRYYLNGVCIEPGEDGGAVCVATDGHRLGARFDREGFCAEATIVRLPAEIKMPPKLIASPWLVGIKTGPGKGHISIIEANSKRDEEDTAKAAIGRVEDCMLRIGQAFIDGGFPDWRKIIPTPSDKDAVRGFNSEYFKSFGRHLSIRGADASSAHLISTGDDPNFLGVLMPMRVDTPAIPQWFAPKPAEQKAA